MIAETACGIVEIKHIDVIRLKMEADQFQHLANGLTSVVLLDQHLQAGLGHLFILGQLGLLGDIDHAGHDITQPADMIVHRLHQHDMIGAVGMLDPRRIAFPGF
ncbi:hypothetical protein SDC9_93286 [bioreactor metagenome]|uniref:Uncharacterized protein n=1 Tax=bioreactor metagenome TaxID=1076179 RepID=A0A645A0L5_9ZZZZ